MSRRFQSCCLILVILGFLAPLASQTLDRAAKPVAPPADPAITYTSALSGLMYVMDQDGSNQTLVHGGSNAMPSWSPDGSQIVFASDSRKGKGIYIINKDGSGQCQLATVNGGSAWPYIGPVWSPLPMGDGKFKVVYADVPVGGINPDLFVVNADCSNPGKPVNITNTPNVTELFPSWSRFANRIAAQVDLQVVVYDVNVFSGVVKVTSQTALSTLGLFPPTRIRVSCATFANQTLVKPMTASPWNQT